MLKTVKTYEYQRSEWCESHSSWTINRAEIGCPLHCWEGDTRGVPNPELVPRLGEGWLVPVAGSHDSFEALARLPRMLSTGVEPDRFSPF